MKNILRTVVVILVFFLGFWSLFKLFQNPAIYGNTLGLVVQNYEYIGDGMRERVRKPFLEITNDNVIQWDGVHYEEIKDHGYEAKAKTGRDFIFAFFPLFPYIWKISCCSAKGVVFLNFLMFTVGVLIMLILLKKKALTYPLLILCLPLTVTFFRDAK